MHTIDFDECLKDSPVYRYVLELSICFADVSLRELEVNCDKRPTTSTCSKIDSSRCTRRAMP